MSKKQELRSAATVLVVDDDPQFRELLKEVLTEAGYRVVTASSGPEALRHFRQARPAVTLLDLLLPEMDGAAVLRELRRLEPTAPVIALTGGADVQLENEVRRLGASDFLRKGLGLDIVVESVDKTLAESSADPATPPRDGTGAARILVVDDEPDVREMLEDFLVREGYRVSTAANGEEALERIATERPHVVLLDLKMPRLGGLAVLRWLRENAPHVAVIILSVVGDTAMIEETMKLGAFDYFAKPFDLDQLGVSVRAKVFLMEKKKPWHRWWGGEKAELPDTVVPDPSRPRAPIQRSPSVAGRAIAPVPPTTPVSSVDAGTTAGRRGDDLTEADVERLEATLRARLRGQAHVRQALIEVLRLRAMGIAARATTPLATLFLAGPAETGRSETADVLAEGLGRPLVRFDMADFASREAMVSLIGSPPGFVGIPESGQLMAAIRRLPNAVLLLDEIEKADASLWGRFLRVFAEGTLQDESFGVDVDFSRTIVVLTSNLLQAGDPSASEADIRRTLVDTRAFPPEFIDGLDRIIVYQPAAAVTREVVEGIIVGMVDAFRERQRLQHLEVEVDRQVVDLIVERGEGGFGARDAQRRAEETVGQALARSFLGHPESWQAAARLRVFVADGAVEVELQRS